MKMSAFKKLSHMLLLVSLLLGTLGFQPIPASARPIPAVLAQIDPNSETIEVQPASNTDFTEPAAPHTIYLQSRQFQPGQPDIEALRQLEGPQDGRVHILLQLDFIPRQTAKDALAAEGIELLAYVPDYAWIASVDASDPSRVLDLPGVTWAGQLAVEDKLDPAIRADHWGSWNRAPDGTAAVFVALFGDESLETGRALVKAHDGKVSGEVIGINLLVVEMPKDQVAALAGEEAVQWIEQALPPLGPATDGSRAAIGVDTLQAAPYDLDGTSVDVLVYDSGQVGAHLDFGARLMNGDADGVSYHSTHVAGTIGGDGSNSVAQGGSALQWRGMAPNVDLLSYGTQGYGAGDILFYNNVPDI